MSTSNAQIHHFDTEPATSLANDWLQGVTVFDDFSYGVSTAPLK